jgi:hypothetical protein
MSQSQRTRANCGTSIIGYRRQAIYCGGPCRAAASHARASSRAPFTHPPTHPPGPP